MSSSEISDLGAFRERLAGNSADPEQSGPMEDVRSLILAMRELHRRLGLLLGAPGEQQSTSGAPVTRFVVQEGDRALIIAVQDVEWIEAAGNYVRLHVGIRQFKLRSSLSALVERLDRAHFMRIHKSTAVNLAHIREVQPWFSGDHVAIMRDGRQLRVSRSYAPTLLRPMW